MNLSNRELERKSVRYRAQILRYIVAAGAGHTGGSLSCVDILKQSYAVERAIKAFESALLEGHLASCVPTGFKEGRDTEMIRELGELFQISRK